MEKQIPPGEGGGGFPPLAGLPKEREAVPRRLLPVTRRNASALMLCPPRLPPPPTHPDRQQQQAASFLLLTRAKLPSCPRSQLTASAFHTQMTLLPRDLLLLLLSSLPAPFLRYKPTERKEQNDSPQRPQQQHHHPPATMAPQESHPDHQLRALAARAVTDSLRAAAARSTAADRAARFRECVRSLEAEKAKMDVFRRELPISVHLVADVIEWLKDELAQQQQHQQNRRSPPPPLPDLFAPADQAVAPARTKQPAAVKAEADANDKRSWMSSAQLWTCGSLDDSTANTNGVATNTPPHKVSTAFMPLASLPTFATSHHDASEKPSPAGMPVPDLSLSSPAVDGACPCPAAAPSATSSAVTDAPGAQRQHQQAQKARRCWSPELHRRFVAALQRLGGAQVATPKQIRELMKVDGLTNDEVKSHLQKYRLHTRRASSDGVGEQQVGLWSSSAAEQQYTTSQHSTSQSGSPQGALQLTVSSRGAMSATAGDSCDGGDEAEGGKSESYSWEMTMPRGTKASSS